MQQSLIGSQVLIIKTNQKGKVVGQSKNVWIIELFGGETKAFFIEELKIN